MYNYNKKALTDLRNDVREDLNEYNQYQKQAMNEFKEAQQDLNSGIATMISDNDQKHKICATKIAILEVLRIIFIISFTIATSIYMMVTSTIVIPVLVFILIMSLIII